MSEPSYFDDVLKARKLKEEALSWIGTPFQHYYQDKFEAGKEEAEKLGIKLDAKGAGIDCIGLAQEIFYRIGATGRWIFPREEADYESHVLGDRVLEWLRGKADDPQSKLLAELFVELEIPDVMKDPQSSKPRDFFKPGDLLVLRHGNLFHMPVIFDHDLHFVNALPRLGVIQGTIQDSSYNIHLIAAFRLRPKP